MNNHLLVDSALIGLLAYLFIGLFPQPIQAEDLSFTISPPTIQVSLDPGGKSEGILRVTNNSNQEQSFSARVEDVDVENKTGHPVIAVDHKLQNALSATSWIGLSPATISLQPHQSEEIIYYIQTPESARPGGFYSVIMVHPIPSDRNPNSHTTVQSQIGSLLYLTIKGAVNEYATIERFSAPQVLDHGPIQISLLIKNLGNIHIQPKGVVSLHNLLGKKIAITELEAFNIFPERNRSYEIGIGKDLFPGPYWATVSLNYGIYNIRHLEASLLVWVIPWQAILTICLGIIFLILAITVKMKNMGGQKPSEMSTQNT